MTRRQSPGRAHPRGRLVLATTVVASLTAATTSQAQPGWGAPRPVPVGQPWWPTLGVQRAQAPALFVFVSGQVAFDPATHVRVEGDAAAEAERVMTNLGTILGDVGLGQSGAFPCLAQLLGEGPEGL